MSPVLPMGRLKRLLAIWLLVALGVLLVVAANGHLVYVAISSQPDCVAHIRQGESTGIEDRFSAARSSCTP
jgi:hypothetical protein